MVGCDFVASHFPIQCGQTNFFVAEILSQFAWLGDRINTNFSTFLDLRYPTNKWIKLGTFHARDERTVQSFPLDEQLYAKYVKVKGCAQMNQSSQSYLIVKFPRNLLISSAHFVARLCPQYSVERKSLRYCQVPDKCS